jgi:hypothetical protein
MIALIAPICLNSMDKHTSVNPLQSLSILTPLVPK